MKNLLNEGLLSYCKSVLFTVVLVIFSLNMNAQVLLTENFEYTVGDLVGKGGWTQQASVSTTPIQVVDNALTYPQYQNAAIGKAIKIEDAGQDVYKEFSEQTLGTVYYAALVNLSAAQSTTIGDYFMHFGEGSGATTGFSGRLFAKTSAGGKLQFAVTRTSVAASAEFASNEYEFDQTHLIVVKYTLKGNGSSAKDDEVALFVNPVITETEPEPILVGTNTSSYNPGKIKGIYVRQGAKGKTALGVIDAIRVSSTWGGLFGFSSGTTPTVTLSTKSLYMGEVFSGETYKETINVKGENLNENITIEGLLTGELTPSTMTILKEDAESENGFDLVLTLTPTSEDYYMEKLQFTTGGETAASLTVMWSATILNEVADLKTLREQTADGWTKYRMNGEVVISHIYKDGSKTYYYLQDSERAITVYDAFGDIKTSYAIGDKVKGLTGTLELMSGSLFLLPSMSTLGELVSSGNEISPATVTLAALADAAAAYESRLVKVENVEFKELEENAVFAYLTNPLISDGTAEAKMRVFKDADYIGTSIPAKATLIGISSAGSGELVAPRSLADILLEPKLEVTPDKLNKVTTNINVPVELGKLTFVTEGLPSEVTLEVRGTNAAFFKPSVANIPTTGRTTEVTIEYNPTTAGMHQATLFIDCEGAEEFSKSIKLSGNGIDPANLPAFTVEPATLPEFSVEIDKEQKQTVLVTTENLLDYLYIKVMGEGEGAFLISTTMMLKNQKDAPFTITFKPKKEGTFTERIEFSSVETETFYLTVTGKATKKAEPGKEGDDFPLDVANPRVLLDEHFDDVAHNQVLSLDGWKTIAVENLRAWWGYHFKDANQSVVDKTAKVTAYSSTATENLPHEMWLVTPPLDFTNAASKMFTFRVMGDILVKDQDAELGLYYMDMADGELYTSLIDIDMPSIPDDNGDWREYHVNLEGQDLADVFFMGFRFKGTGGNANSAVYYIDDVSYGRTDLPSLSTPTPAVAFSAVVNTEVTTEPISVVGSNLAEQIQLSLGGPNAGKFDLPVKTLPATGGSFTIQFSSDQVGVHEAYVKVSSRGAADMYIAVSANNTQGTVGINTSLSDQLVNVIVYDLLGREIVRKNDCDDLDAFVKTLKTGNYIMHLKSREKVETIKVLIP